MAYNAFSQNNSLQINNGMNLMNTPQPPLPPTQPPAMLPDQQQSYNQQLQAMQQQYQQQMQHLHQMSMMHPAMNDQPLEFNNLNKKQPPLPQINDQPNNANDARRDEENERRERDRDRRGGSGTRERERRDRRDRDRDRDRNDRNDDRKVKRDGEDKQVSTTTTTAVPAPPLPPAIPGMPMMGIGGVIGGMMGGMSGMMAPGMMPMMGGMDPTAIMGLQQYGMVPGMMPEGSIMPAETTMTSMMGSEFSSQRTVLEFKECTLVPPSPMAPVPHTRERPPGCRTVYVGGLPDNVTEEIIRDVFGRCGEMLSVRLSRKNFCHVRFAHEESVDAAMLYSGYRMRIGNSTDAANTGRLHVDYAQARVDQYEYECKQRALQREARHRERVERDRLRPASPPPVPHYTDHEAGNIAEQIKTDEGFIKSVQTVVAWLERGDLSKRNANTFYSMIQSTHSHVRRLINEKMQYEEELQSAKDHHRSAVHNIVVQFGLIEKVFGCASHKKCWDHFTKAQRKNIEAWKKQSSEIKQLQLVDSMNEEMDEEMDVSDNDDGEFGLVKKRAKTDTVTLKEENDSLKCQLEAYKNEVDLVKLDLKADMEAKDQQIRMLQQTIKNMSNELAKNQNILLQETAMVNKLKAKAKKDSEEVGEEEGEFNEKIEAEEKGENVKVLPVGIFSEKDARLIGLISTFLHVHPFGAGVDYVWSYLSKLDPSVRVQEVESLLSRFPGVFRQELSGIGATLERRWVFCGYQPVA